MAIDDMPSVDRSDENREVDKVWPVSVLAFALVLAPDRSRVLHVCFPPPLALAIV